MCLFEIMLMITSIFAFGFFMGNVGFVSARSEEFGPEEVVRGIPGGIGQIFSNFGGLISGIFGGRKKPGATAAPTPTAVPTKPSVPTSFKINNLPSGVTPRIEKGVASFTYNGKKYISKGGGDFILEGVSGGAVEGVEEYGSWISKQLKIGPPGELGDAIVSGVQWAGIAYGAGELIGAMFGLRRETTTALSAALSAGFGVGKLFATLGQKGGALYGAKGPLGWMGANPAITGIGVGILVFLLLYKKTQYRVVTFNCRPWQAPTSGADCEKCNDDRYDCSEYRCKSLGQSCELVNPGTAEERCINNHRDDVNAPEIDVNWGELTAGHSYKDVKKLPPGPGFEIVRDEADNGCIKAFTPLSFGITANEPAQCKIDSQSTQEIAKKDRFEAMSYWLGGSNLYKYNHTEVFSLPGPANLQGENLTIKNDGNWTFFIRCRDFNGNQNEAEYAIRFCVDPSPDTTPPVVMATSIENNGYVPANTDSANVEFYVNEPASCKWSFDDQSYVSMENNMVCAGNVYEMNSLLLYTCKAELSGIDRNGTDFYIRCKDQPGANENDRMVMQNSFKFKLSGSTELKVKNLQPNATIFGSTDPAKVELKVETLFGAEQGKAICFYATEDNDGDYIQFLETDDVVHKQRQDLTDGSYTYWYKCVDRAGNIAKDSTSFNVDVDTSAPVVARVYEEGGKLKIVTVKNSECAYTFDNCNFLFEEGTNMPTAGTKVHVADWNHDKTYYIKCRDEFKNEEADCSVVVRPSRKL